MPGEENPVSSERKVVCKDSVFTGSHNYFFEVREANNGAKYVVIVQSTKVESGFESAKMVLFEGELLGFQRILRKMIRAILDDADA